MGLSAEGRTTDGSEFDGTDEGVDRVVPGLQKLRLFYHLTSVTFRTEGIITNLEIILWDPDRDERVALVDTGRSSEQTWAGDLRVPKNANGNSCEVRVITTGQTVALALLRIDGKIAE